jgi:hypothetical protein
MSSPFILRPNNGPLRFLHYSDCIAHPRPANYPDHLTLGLIRAYWRKALIYGPEEFGPSIGPVILRPLGQ